MRIGPDGYPRPGRLRRAARRLVQAVPVGFSPSGVAFHWEGEGRIARPDHGQCAAQVQDIRNYHLTHGYSDIAYNLLACVHGGEFVGRGWNAQSAATCNGTYNRRFRSVCSMIGTGDHVTPELLRTLRSIADRSRSEGRDEFIGHRDACSTQCPGDELLHWVHNGMPIDGAPTPPPEPEPVPAQRRGDPKMRLAQCNERPDEMWCFGDDTYERMFPQEYLMLAGTGMPHVERVGDFVLAGWAQGRRPIGAFTTQPPVGEPAPEPAGVVGGGRVEGEPFNAVEFAAKLDRVTRRLQPA